MKKFPEVTRQVSLPDQVYEAVHQKISSGEIDHSARLTETQLASLLGVSRTPVREALARLRHDGLLDPTPRGKLITALSHEDVREILEVRQLIEPYIAARAAELADPEGVAALQAALDLEIKSVSLRSPEKFTQANHDFREVLVRLAGNQRLAETARRYEGQLQSMRRATLEKRENRDIVVSHHKDIVRAVASGNQAMADKKMRELMTAAGKFTMGMAIAGNAALPESKTGKKSK